MEYFCGIDIGTTGCKAILVDKKGEIKARFFKSYPLSILMPGFAEQNPEDWWKGVIFCLKKIVNLPFLSPSELKGIGISGQMHGLVLLDKDRRVLRPAILWCDERTKKEAEYINKKIEKVNLFKITGNPAFISFTAPKILWVKRNEPEIYKKIDKILLPKDYIRYRLTDLLATEPSDASGTLLFDIRRGEWSKELLEKIKIPFSFMPEILPSGNIIGKVQKKVADRIGLLSDVPVIGGAADSVAHAVGCGVVEEGIISCILGTSGVVAAFSNFPAEYSFCHTIPNKWLVVQAIHSAGESFHWFKENFAFSKSFDSLISEAMEIEPGSQGLLFLPFLMGERVSPDEIGVKGAFYGISSYHKKKHFTRAILEGVSFALNGMIESLKFQKIEINQVRISGGGAKSKDWVQMLSDIFSIEVVTLDKEEGAAYGVALMTMVATGFYSDLPTACNKTIHIKEHFRLQPKENILYKKFYLNYQKLYSALKI